jgi:5'(3')-deoxyribonucleotidase/uncharacterized protein with PQ loop repeat
MSVIALLGILAAFCANVAFVPQIIKLRKQGGDDLSYPMLFLYLTGVSLWLVYGLMIHAVAVIWANAFAVLLVTISIVLKANPPIIKTNLKARRLRIAIDMDEVIADAFSEHLRRYNQLTGANLTKETVARNGLCESIPSEHRGIFDSIADEVGFFADLRVIEGSQNALAILSQHHDIFIASAAMEVPTSFDAKFKWLEKHFPFIPPSRIVFCGDKHIINADVLIDDRSRHFKKFPGTGILFTAPHNANEAAPLRANNWDEVVQILSDKSAEVVVAKRPSRTLSMNPAES